MAVILVPEVAPLHSEPERVVRSAGTVSAAVLLSRVSGVAREMVMAYAFGANYAHDAFLLGFRIPNLPRDLLAEGAFASAFVPTFTRPLVEADLASARELARQVTSAILLVVGSLCLLGMFFAPQLVSLLAPGFAAEPEKLALAVRLTRIMCPFLLLIALSSQATGMLNAHGSFGRPATASIFFNIGAIGGGVLLGWVAGPLLHLPPVEGMAYGVVAGGALQLGWQLPPLRRRGFRFVPQWKFDHPGLLQLGRLMLPGLVGSLAMQINLIVNTSFASRLVDPVRGHDGPVSWLGFALRFVQLPMGIFAVAMASAMLPSISRSAAAGNLTEFKATLSRSLSMVFFLAVPSSALLIVLGRAMIGAVYQSGHFQPYDTRQTSLALTCYAAGLVSFGTARLLIPAYYALSDSRTPMYLSILSIAANLALPLVLLNVFHMNFAAMALTTSIAMSLEGLLLFQGLRRKLKGLDSYSLLRCFCRILAAAAVMGVPLFFLDKRFSLLFGPSRTGCLLELALLLPAGVLLFLAASRLFRVEELPLAAHLLAQPLGRFTPLLSDRLRS